MEIAMTLYGVYDVDDVWGDTVAGIFLTEEDAYAFIASEEESLPEELLPGSSSGYVVRPVPVYEMKASVAAIDEDTRWTIC